MDEDLKRYLEAMRQENAETAQRFEERLNGMSAEMRNTAIEIRAQFEAVTARLEKENAETRQFVETTAAETRQYVDERLTTTAAETRQFVETTAAETRQYVETTAAETRQFVEETAIETRRHFGVVAEGLETKIDFLTEGHVATNERIDRLDAKVDGLAADMAKEFESTRSMIEFSHHELDRRVTALEEQRPAGSR